MHACQHHPRHYLVVTVSYQITAGKYDISPTVDGACTSPRSWLADLQMKTMSQHDEMLVQMRESEKRKGSKRKGHMDDDTERHAMPGNRKPAKQGRR